MKKYKVIFTEIIDHEVKVMADSDKEAFEAVALGLDVNDTAKIVEDNEVDSMILGSRYAVEESNDEENNQTYFYI